MAGTIAQWLGVLFALVVPLAVLSMWPRILREISAVLLAQASAVEAYRAQYRMALAEQRRALNLPETAHSTDRAPANGAGSAGRGCLGARDAARCYGGGGPHEHVPEYAEVEA